MKRAGTLAVWVFALTMLAGCISVGSGDPSPLIWYELSPGTDAKTGSAASSAPALRLDVRSGSPFYDALAIAYSRASGQRAYYRFANWTEPLAPRLAKLLRHSLAAGGSFSAVALPGEALPLAHRLQVSIVDFYHDVAQSPGQVRIRVELLWQGRHAGEPARRTMLAASAAVERPDAASAVQAFAHASEQLFDEIAGWANEQAQHSAGG